MSKELILKIKGLKRVSEVGLPTPPEENDQFESVFFLADLGHNELIFRLGTYNFEEKTFRSDNGYGGEIWHAEDIVAWNYWTSESGEENITVTIEE